MSKAPKPQQKNSFEHDDLEQILAEIGEFEDEQESNRARTRNDNSILAKKIQKAKKRATAELNIPRFILDAAIATKVEVRRKAEANRRIDEIAQGIPSDGVELWADAVGQFSFLQPEEADEEETDPVEVVSAAAGKASKRAKANQEAEQEEGDRLLDEALG